MVAAISAAAPATHPVGLPAPDGSVWSLYELVAPHVGLAPLEQAEGSPSWPHLLGLAFVVLIMLPPLYRAVCAPQPARLLSATVLLGSALLMLFPAASAATHSLMAMPLCLLALEGRATARLFLLYRLGRFARAAAVTAAAALPLSPLVGWLPAALTDQTLPRLLCALLAQYTLTHHLSTRPTADAPPASRPLFRSGWRLLIAFVAFDAFVSTFPLPAASSPDAAGGEAGALRLLAAWLAVTAQATTTAVCLLLAGLAHRSGFPRSDGPAAIREDDGGKQAAEVAAVAEERAAQRTVALQDALEKAKRGLDESRESQQMALKERDEALAALQAAQRTGGGGGFSGFGGGAADEGELGRLRLAAGEAEQLRTALDEAKAEAQQTREELEAWRQYGEQQQQQQQYGE